MGSRWTALPLILGIALAAQAPQRLDYMTYTLPAGDWRTEVKPGSVHFSQELPGKGRCHLAIFRAVPSHGSLEGDAAADWEAFVLARHPGIPKGKSRTQPHAGSGWTFTQQVGMAPQELTDTILSVHTCTGHGQHMSVVFESTHPAFDALLNPFIRGLKMHGPVQAQVPSVAPSNFPIPNRFPHAWYHAPVGPDSTVE